MTPSVDTMIQCAKIVAQEYPIERIDLFGSRANGTYHEKSDVDLLVEFRMPRVSLLVLNQVKYRMEELLQREVDVVHAPLPESAMIEVEKRITLYGA